MLSRGQLKGPIHSHSTQQHSWPPVTASATEVLQGLPVCGGECPDTMTCPLLPERKKRAWSMRLPRSPDPVPSWNETQWCSGVFLVLATAGQPQWAHFRHPNHKAHLRKPNFNSGPWDKLLATRPEANVRQDKG